MPDYIFRPPTVEEGPAGGHRLFEFYRLNKGITIVREPTGSYAQVRYLVDEDLKIYPEVYLGGRQHTVNETTKAALIAGNVGVTEDNFTAI
jgi:hypothetical protein